MKKIILLTLFLVGCSDFIELTQDTEVIEGNELNIYFSHNIQGETHPCGCRNFPLGGLPQAFGVIHQEKNIPRVYVDTGNTFFASSAIPDTVAESNKFTAKKLAEAFDIIGMTHFVPGAYDFAFGEKFLVDIASKSKFKFLISNASKSLKIKHIPFEIIQTKKYDIVLLGIVSPSLIRNGNAYLFETPLSAIKRRIKEVSKISPERKKRYILLSHSGVSDDKKMAKELPQLEWIIGSHNQAFLKQPITVGKTNIVQVLSRNHHIGHIQLDLSKTSGKYTLHQADDKAQDLVKENPLKAWLVNYKTELDQVQAKEQEAITIVSTPDKKVATNISCLDCHDSQYTFWQETAHSIGLLTLAQSKAINNTACIECHSLHFGKETGFKSTKQIAISSNEKFDSKKYLNEMMKLTPKNSIRKLSKKERLEISKKWHDLDESMDITHNFGNIQCLHCHTNKTSDHPFDNKKTPKPDYKATCIKCHTTDQSPEWYEKDTNGVATSLNNEYFAEKLKQVSCPKIED